MLHPLTSRYMLYVGSSRCDEYNQRDDHEHGGDEVPEGEADVLLDVHHQRERNGRPQINKHVEPTNIELSVSRVQFISISENAMAEPRLINR